MTTTRHTYIDIPFMGRRKRVMLDGVKIRTSRNRRYGRHGDRFRAFDAEFEITFTYRMSLELVRDTLWQEEGVSSPQAFMRVWKDLHPKAGWTPAKEVWVHCFKRVA